MHELNDARDLFVDLYAYRQRENRNPLEDWLTECLAATIRALPSIQRRALLARLSGATIDDPEAFLAAHRVDIVTQYQTVAAGRPDILILLDDQPWILFENKVSHGVSDMKRQLILLRLALDLYATTSEERDAAAPKPPGLVPADDELAQLLGRRITMSMMRTGVDPVELRPKLDALIERIRTMRTYGAEIWWQELARPVTANELSAHFSGIWFSGLSPVQAAAVTVLRYLKAETWIERMVAERMPDADIALVRDNPAVPRLDVSAFDSGLKERAKDLLFLYRREVLRDKMPPKAGSTLATRAKNAGTKPIGEGLKFLKTTPARTIDGDHGDLTSRARTLYLLDVIPESRLAR